MRDLKRIDRILSKLGTLWKKTPNQRLFQFLFNYTQLGTRATIGTIKDPFHYEDDTLETQLDYLLKEKRNGE